MYLFLWFYLRINSIWTTLSALRTDLLEHVPVDSTEWHLFILGDVPASMSLLVFLILMVEYIPNDKYPRGQVVHQQRYMFGG